MARNIPFVADASDLANGSPARVYWNLRRKCWSVQCAATGRVVCHAERVHLLNVSTIVRPAGRAKVLREKKKNVHAFVEGLVVTPAEIILGQECFSILCDAGDPRHTRIRYNPYQGPHFVEPDGRQALSLYQHALLSYELKQSDVGEWARRPVCFVRKQA